MLGPLNKTYELKRGSTNKKRLRGLFIAPLLIAVSLPMASSTAEAARGGRIEEAVLENSLGQIMEEGYDVEVVIQEATGEEDLAFHL